MLPNVSGPLIVLTALATAPAILTESSLSFLGLGVQPPTPGWGSMLDTAKGCLETAPWMALFPGSATFLVRLAYVSVGASGAFQKRTASTIARTSSRSPSGARPSRRTARAP